MAEHEPTDDGTDDVELSAAPEPSSRRAFLLRMATVAGAATVPAIATFALSGRTGGSGVGQDAGSNVIISAVTFGTFPPASNVTTTIGHGSNATTTTIGHGSNVTTTTSTTTTEPASTTTTSTTTTEPATTTTEPTPSTTSTSTTQPDPTTTTPDPTTTTQPDPPTTVAAVLPATD